MDRTNQLLLPRKCSPPFQTAVCRTVLVRCLMVKDAMFLWAYGVQVSNCIGKTEMAKHFVGCGPPLFLQPKLLLPLHVYRLRCVQRCWCVNHVVNGTAQRLETRRINIPTINMDAHPKGRWCLGSLLTLGIHVECWYHSHQLAVGLAPCMAEVIMTMVVIPVIRALGSKVMSRHWVWRKTTGLSTLKTARSQMIYRGMSGMFWC